MEYKYSIQHYRKWYGRLLRLYSRPYYERFGQEMEQIFSDLLRECAQGGRSLFRCAVWVFIETSVGIIKENLIYIIMRSKRIMFLALTTAGLLLIPFVAMRFTPEVNWTGSDFVFAGVLIFGTGLAYELVAMRTKNFIYRVAVGLALAGGFLLTWINLAVGIIGSENNPANALYLGIPVIGVIGALVARFRSRGLSRTLFVLALVQILIPMIAFTVWRPQALILIDVLRVMALNGFFAVLFLISGFLFRRADEGRQMQVR